MKEFRPFRLDVRNQALWKGPERLALMPKPFAVLAHLVEHAGHLVTQDELLSAVWPDTFVQPEVLRKHILEIRRVLDDRADAPRFVATLPKRGYTFIAPVTDLDTQRPERAMTTATIDRAPALPGRAEPLAQLRDGITHALAGTRAMVFVTGEPGIGKTTLVDAWQRSMAADPRVTILRGQTVEGFAGKEPYYPLLDALSAAAGTEAATPIVASLQRFAPTWLAQLPVLATPGATERRRDPAGVTREGMVREICDALEAASAVSALAIVLEDLHWADSSTLDVLSALARRRQRARLLVIATYRPADVIVSGSPLKTLKQDLLLHGLCREIALERLTPVDVRRHISSEFGALPDVFSDIVHRHSDGNPLFMQALLAHLVRQGVIAAGTDGWRLTADARSLEPGIPDTLKQMLKATLDGLSPPERRVLDAASVQGTTFQAWAVDAILDPDSGDVEAICDALCDGAQLLHDADDDPANGSPDGRRYRFSHALYRELLYRRLSVPVRTQAHRRLANAIVARAEGTRAAHATELAEHFEKGHVFTEAVHYAILAAQLAARRLAHAEAIAICERALTLLPEVDQAEQGRFEFRLASVLGDAAYALGDARRSASAYERAATSAARLGVVEDEADALFRLAGPTALFDPDGAIAACECAVALGAAAGHPVVEHRGRLLTASWRILFHGWRAEDSEACRQSVAALGAQPIPAVPAHDLMLLAHVQFIQSEYAEAAASARLGLDTLTPRDALWECVAGMTAEAVASMYLGQYGVAYTRLQSGLDLARKNGNQPWEGILQGVMASVHLHTCDYDGARAIATAILGALEAAPMPQIGINMLFTRGFAELWSGDPAAARTSFQKALDEGAAAVFPLHWYFRMFARLGLGEAALAQGDAGDATVHANLLLPLTENCRDVAIQALAWDLKARADIAGGDLRAARGSLDRAIAALRAFDVPMVAWQVHATGKTLESRLGHAAAARQHQQRAADILTGMAATLDPCPHLRAALLNDARVRDVVNGQV
jgi:DNA-binding winged helix-turn-helix (wHTH) protein/tetratricopeptide (TPR) repeat protein